MAKVEAKKARANVVTKTTLVDAVARKTKFSKKDTAAVIDATVAAITGALVEGSRVTIIGFGSFVVAETSEREGRNPQTGAKIKIKAAKRPKFVAGKGLKEAVNKRKK